MALAHRGQVGPLPHGGHGCLGLGGVGRRSRCQYRQHRALLHLVAHGDGDGLHDRRVPRLDDVLHLHGLDHGDLAAGRHGVPHPGDAHHRPLQRRPDLRHGRKVYPRTVSGPRTAVSRLSSRGDRPVALSDHVEQPLPRSRQRARRRLRRRLRHLHAGPRPHRRRLRGRGPRRVHGHPARHPAGPDRRDARRLLQDRRRHRRDGHLRGLRRPLVGVRHRRPGHRAQPGRCPDRPRGRRRSRRPRRRVHRPGHQVRLARPDPVRRAPRRLRGPGARAPRGRRRPVPRGDPVRPARRQGGHDRLPPGDGLLRSRGADPGAGHHGAHRHHAPRHRDRRRPVGARRHAPRRHRHQLRHRPVGDERAPALPQPARPHADLLPPQRRPSVRRRREDALRPHAGAAGRLPAPLRHGVRRAHRRRLLRHHGRAHQGRGRQGQGRHPGAPQPGPRGRCHLDLQLHALRAGPHVPVHR